MNAQNSKSEALNPAAFFQTEREVFKRSVAGWLKQHRGQYVVIRGTQTLGFEPTYGDAVRLGQRNAQIGQFMVKQVNDPATTVEWVSHIATSV